MSYEYLINDLIDRIARLPTVGRKSSAKIVYSLLSGDKEDATKLLNTLSKAVQHVKPCSVCNVLTEHNLCNICSVQTRLQRREVIVVSNPLDVQTIEDTGLHHGTYFVLNGLINPLQNNYAEKVGISKFILFLRQHDIKEVTLAFNSSPEADATSELIVTICHKLGIPCYRFATGLPTGGSFSNADPNTIMHSYQNRIKN